MPIAAVRSGVLVLLGLSAGIPVLAGAPFAADGVPRPAQAAAPAALPEARDVLERHVKAIGGRDAVMAHSSRHVTGTIAMPSAGLSGSFEVFEAKPNRAVMRITIPGVGEMSEGFNGDVGWSVNPMSGPSLLQGKQLEEKKLDADFFADVQPEKRYTSMKTVERVEFDGRSCFKLQLQRRDGGEDVQYYDAATGLRAGSVVTRESQMGPVNATVTESDYKAFGKVQYPTKIVNTAMGLQQVMTIVSVVFDSVDPSVFDPPAPIKALIK